MGFYDDVKLFVGVFTFVFWLALGSMVDAGTPSEDQAAEKAACETFKNIVVAKDVVINANDYLCDELYGEITNFNNCTSHEASVASSAVYTHPDGIMWQRIHYTSEYNDAWDDSTPYGPAWVYIDRYDAGEISWQNGINEPVHAIAMNHFNLAIATWEDEGPLDPAQHTEVCDDLDHIDAHVDACLGESIALGEYLVDCAESGDCLECGEPGPH
jgi:hypothetical protein